MPEEVTPPVTAKVVGGPEDNSGGNKTPTPAGDSNKNNEPQKKYTTASGKEFNTPDELHAYTSGLEEELVKKAFQNNQQHTQAPPAQQPKAWEEEVAETIFTDPVGTMKKIKEKVRDEISAEDTRKSAARTFWDGFYQDNPDLKNAQRIVVLTSQELSRDPEFGKLPAAQVTKRLADEVRMAIKDIAKGGETEQVIAGKPAPMLSGSNPIPKVTGTQAKPKTFVDQIKEMKANRSKRKAG